MSNVTTYQDLLDNDHAALVAECATLYPLRSVGRVRRNQRSYDAMLAEYQATLSATSINMINFKSTPWS